MNSTVRISLQILGFISLALGFAGAFLPVLPTTPFILLSAWCFAKSSQKWHAYLHNHREFGALIQNWQRDRSVAMKHKLTATAMIAISLTGMWLSDRPVELKAGLSLGLGVIWLCLMLTKTAAVSSGPTTSK